MPTLEPAIGKGEKGLPGSDKSQLISGRGKIVAKTGTVLNEAGVVSGNGYGLGSSSGFCGDAALSGRQWSVMLEVAGSHNWELGVG